MDELVCVKCGREFLDKDVAVRHALSEKHYNFRLKGTKYHLCIV